MGLYTLIGKDGPRGVELRKLHRDAHLENLRALVAAGRVTYAGPLRREDGLPCGSVVIFEAETLEQARQIAQDDPYTQNGIFESVEVFATVQVFPET